MAAEEHTPLLTPSSCRRIEHSSGSQRRLSIRDIKMVGMGRKVAVDVLAILFGIGAWVSINGLWVELPLLVQDLPEGWNLPSYLSVVIQIANIGPITYAVIKSMWPSLRSNLVIYGVLTVGMVASLLLALLWDITSWINGTEHSTALLSLVFFLALVDCTSSVLFMPYMAVWRQIYLPSYLIGEGLSGLLPALVALVQGVGGNAKCENVTVVNVTDEGNYTYTELQQVPPSPRFSVTSFFFFLMSMMICSWAAFVALEKLSSIQGERTVSQSTSSSVTGLEASNRQLVGAVDHDDSSGKEGEGMRPLVYGLMLASEAWASSLTNGVLPSIQSYSCGAYGNVAYHLAATLSALANPLAALATLVLPRARRWLLTLLGIFGTLVAAYIMATAALSPTPPLVGTHGGAALVVLSWIAFTGSMTYVRVEIVNQMREEGARALFWCGAVTQAGSAVGAVTTFLLVNVYNLFHAYYPC